MNVADITPDLMRIARWRAGFVLECEHAIDDAIQNALIQLWSKGHPAKFLPQGAYWAALKLFSKRSAYQPPTDKDGNELDYAVDHAKPDGPMQERERRTALRGVLTNVVSQMTERQRQALSLKLNGGTHETVGRQMGISGSASSALYRNALAHLREAS
jgi:DNA-directed RNA polymerase specialized sigma24 family protein